MIYNYKDIRGVHLEISSLCNAECPLCPRNFFSYPLNNGYKEHAMTIDEAKKIFPSEFVGRLDNLHINGNFGDLVMCPDAVDIVKWFRQNNPKMKISASTNGGARNVEFWQELAKLDCRIVFCLDGLKDTHSIYRRNTVFETVIKNAKTFISAGGRADWKFIVFDHNKHQINEARILSQQLGFVHFELVDHGRNQGPIFDHKKELVGYLGTQDHKKNFDQVYSDYFVKTTLDDLPAPKRNPIICKVKQDKSVYVNSLGEVYPCCWLGFNPKTFGKVSHFEITNSQIKSIISDNDALEHPLEHTIKWFDRVSESWNKKTYQEGLLFSCNHYCA